jgi:tripartite-type tricarboxylate transporter receptor subunit TctC
MPVIALAAALFAPSAPAQQTMRILVGFAPGGSTDVLARFLAERLREPLARNVIVDNRPGAAGRLVVEATRAAAPDGGTLMLVPSGPMTLFPHIFRNLRYDPARDFTPLARIAEQDLCLAVGAEIAAKSMAEFRDWVKANPKRASYGTAGAGTLQHFGGVLLAQRLGVELVHVPYKGAAPAVIDLVGGQIPMLVTSCADVLEAHRTGRARVLGSTGRARSPFAPEVPTLRAQGLDVQISAWFALWGPAGMPPALAQSIERAVLGVVSSPEGQAQLAKLAMVAWPGTAEDIVPLRQRDFALMGEIVKLSGFKPED